MTMSQTAIESALLPCQPKEVTDLKARYHFVTKKSYDWDGSFPLDFPVYSFPFSLFLWPEEPVPKSKIPEDVCPYLDEIKHSQIIPVENRLENASQQRRVQL